MALHADWREFLSLLNRNKVRFVVVGAHALAGRSAVAARSARTMRAWALALGICGTLACGRTAPYSYRDPPPIPEDSGVRDAGLPGTSQPQPSAYSPAAVTITPHFIILAMRRSSTSAAAYASLPFRRYSSASP